MQGTTLQEQAAALSARAHDRLLNVLMARNTVSKKHRQATLQMLEGMASQAVGLDPGRYAYGLPCGGGKTQGVVALIAASHELELGLTFAVATSQIEALCGIKRDLLEAGVLAESIGLMHGYKWRSATDAADAVGPGTGYASEPATPDDREYPILLMSHAKIQHGHTATYAGNSRSLLVWDESLISTTAAAMSLNDIRRVRALAEIDKPELVPYIDKIAKVVVQELSALNADPSRQPKLLTDLLSLGELVCVEQIASTLGRGNKMAQGLREEVHHLMSLISLPVSVLTTGNGDSGGGFLRYNVAVSDDLRNVAILDASHVLRELTQADKSIADRTTPEMIGYKSYSNVTVTQVKLAAGKQTMTAGVEGSLAAAREVQRAIEAASQDECVLVFTFKDAKRALARNLSKLGVDLDACVEVDGLRRRRVELLTWGQETSRNDLLHCQTVIMAGVLRRNPLELAAALTGQQRTGESPHRHSAETLLRLNLTEMAHCVLQGMNRGACRVMDGDGQARRMALTILVDGYGAAGLREALRPVLPRIVWASAQPPTKTPSRTAQAARAIENYLATFTASRVSVRAIRGVLEIKLGSDALREAVDSALWLALEAGHRWRRDGRSLVRESLRAGAADSGSFKQLGEGAI